MSYTTRDTTTDAPSLLERHGVHGMRLIAVTWCRAHPAEAAEMPGWSLELLSTILHGVQ